MALLEKAAVQGHVYAMAVLGDIYHENTPGWFTKGAEAGLPNTSSASGPCSTSGRRGGARLPGGGGLAHARGGCRSPGRDAEPCTTGGHRDTCGTFKSVGEVLLPSRRGTCHIASARTKVETPRRASGVDFV